MKDKVPHDIRVQTILVFFPYIISFLAFYNVEKLRVWMLMQMGFCGLTFVLTMAIVELSSSSEAFYITGIALLIFYLAIHVYAIRRWTEEWNYLVSREQRT